MSTHRWDEYAEHRTRAEVDRLLHHGHPIPVSHGITDAHVAEHFPGWTWNDLLAVWKAAGVLVRRGGAPPACHPQVRTVHFDGPTAFAVEWVDGTVTTSGPGHEDS